jgi:hypothetical protein
MNFGCQNIQYYYYQCGTLGETFGTVYCFGEVMVCNDDNVGMP